MTTWGWGEAFFYRRAPCGRISSHAHFRDFQPLAVSKNVKIANPLALYRLKVLEDSFSKPADFEAFVRGHAQRVRWQLQRIYRERNTVMHNGESSPFINQLLSNTYYYYHHTFFNIETVSNSYGALSIAQSLSAVQKLFFSDQDKLTRSKKLEGLDGPKAKEVLLSIVAGHFHNEETVLGT